MAVLASLIQRLSHYLIVTAIVSLLVKGRNKEMFYLTTTQHIFIYGYVGLDYWLISLVNYVARSGFQRLNLGLLLLKHFN